MGGERTLMVSHKDVVLAVLGASAGLAGLTLVFLGLVVSAYQSYETATKKIRERYRHAAVVVLAAFFCGVLCVALATAWLVNYDCNTALYVAVIVSFAVELVLLCGATVLTVRRVMWR